MNVKKNDYILFKVDEELFDRATQFQLAFLNLGALHGYTSLLPKLVHYKNVILHYYPTTPRQSARLVVEVPISKKIRPLITITKNNVLSGVVGIFQGKVLAINPDPTPSHSISIDQATPVDLASRYIDLGSGASDIEHGKVYYKDYEQLDRWIELYSSDTTNIELKLKANSGYMTARAKIKLQIDPHMLGFDFTGRVDIPYTVKAGKITIPACCIFEDTVSTDTPNFLAISFQVGTDTKYYCFIDDKQVLIYDGFTIKDELNETLDSGYFEFISIGGELPLEPFDSVTFDSEEVPSFELKRQLLDTYVGEICNFNSTLANSDYYYKVNIFSETKQLERITLPNLAITKRAIGEQQTVFDKVKEYCKRYLPYIRVYDGEINPLVPSLMYDKNLESVLDMPCPEFVWNTPTLREVLTDLFSVADLIPIVKNGILTYIDLKLKGKAIDESKLTNRQISGTSADYCDNMTLPMKNIMSKRPVIKSERISCRSTGGELTTDNGMIITSKPIYNIISIHAYIKTTNKYDSAASGHKDEKFFKYVDITNYVKEEKEFSLLSQKTRWSIFGDLENVRPELLQICNLSYKRGNNYIEGVLKTTSLRHDIDTETYSKINWVAIAALYPEADMLHMVGSKSSQDVDDPNHNYMERHTIEESLKVFFDITYETIEETTVNVSREKLVKHMQNSLFDSQSANSVDLDHQTIFEYAKINRLSNKIEIIYGEYFNEADIPELADYIGDKILFSREISYYDDIIYFKGQIVDNYILRDYFTGIQSKRRSWNIADTDEAINRDDYYKCFISFDTQKFYDTDGYYFMRFDSFELDGFINVFAEDSNRYNKCFALTHDGDYNYFPDDYVFGGVLEVLTMETAYSIMISTKFADNMKIGDNLEKDEDIFTQHPVKYVDDNGEFAGLQLSYVDYLDEGDDNYSFNDRLVNIFQEYHDDLFNWLVEQVNKRPIITNNDMMTYRQTLIAEFQKDNREIIGTNLHFEYVSNNPRIVVGKNFSKCVPAGSHEITSDDIGIKFALNHNYKYGDTESVGTDYGYEATIDGQTGEISCPDFAEFAESPNCSWCFYRKSTGELLLGINTSWRIYANMLYVRDTNIYNDIVHKEKIGNVFDTAQDLYEAYNRSSKYINTFKAHGDTMDIEDYAVPFVEIEEPYVPTAKVFTKVTSLSQLQHGSKVLIGTKNLLRAEGGGVADIGNKSFVGVDISGGVISVIDDSLDDCILQVLSIGDNGDIKFRNNGRIVRNVKMVQSGIITRPEFVARRTTGTTFNFQSNSLKIGDVNDWLGYVLAENTPTFMQITGSGGNPPDTSAVLYVLNED